MFLRVHPQNPEPRKMKEVVDCLNNGGIIIYPTDTLYGIGCSIYQKKAIERLGQIKNVQWQKANFSIVCSDISEVTEYAKSTDTAIFRLMKKCLPGPYTFILEAGRNLPKILQTKKNTVGIRIPDNIICRAVVEQLGHPIISTTIPESKYVEDYTLPDLFYEYYENIVDIIIDGGTGGIVPSTIIDCTGGYPELIREGAGDIHVI